MVEAPIGGQNTAQLPANPLSLFCVAPLGLHLSALLNFKRTYGQIDFWRMDEKAAVLSVSRKYGTSAGRNHIRGTRSPISKTFSTFTPRVITIDYLILRRLCWLSKRIYLEMGHASYILRLGGTWRAISEKEIGWPEHPYDDQIGRWIAHKVSGFCE